MSAAALAGKFDELAAPTGLGLSGVDVAERLESFERLERIDDTHFDASWGVKLGPICGTFAGSIELSDVQPPVSYHMTAIGRGPVGVVTGEADFWLRAEGEATVLSYDLDARISGRLASIGQRLVESSMRSLVRDALQGLSESIRERVAGESGGSDA